jgi:hypothetical protein
MGRRSCLKRNRRRRSVALILVLIAVTISATLALAFVSAQSTSIGIARNIQNHPQARYVAESGLELAIAYMRANTDWRTVQSEGAWVTDEPFAGGTFTVVGEDGVDIDGDGVIAVPGEGDGDLADDNSERLTLTVTGRAGGASQVVHAVITPVPGRSLVGYWKLDETTGLIANDSSGGEHHGTVTNTAPEPGWETAYVDGGLHLDGTDDFIAVTDDPALDLSDAGTLALWFKMDSFKSFGGLIHKGDAKNFSDEAYTLQFWSGSRVYLGLKGGGQSRSIQTNTVFNNGQWYHVAAVWDATGMYLYVDGALDRSSSNTVSAMDSPGNLNLGAQLAVYYSSSYHNLPFDGIIDDVRIYAEALSAEDVEALYNLEMPAGGGAMTYQVQWTERP